MTNKNEPNDFTNTSSFSKNEEKTIEHQVDFELNEMQLKMTKVGATTNIFGGLLVIWLLHKQIDISYLFTWYAVFFALNITNIVFSFYFQYCKVTPDKIENWLRAYHYLIMPPVCIAWGIIGILSLPADIQHQFYIITLLLAVLICFSLGTITDFTASIISIAGLLLPSLGFRGYQGIASIIKTDVDLNLNLGVSICFFILGIFLLITCFIGYKLIKKSIKLSYINVSLNKKLGNMNKFLEQRVKERTNELEKSLQLVTYQATHDLLTDLPNQRLLSDLLKKSISESNQNSSMMAVVCMSLNEIDRINDGMGHPAGDHVIQTIANRLRDVFNSKQVAAEKLKFQFALSRKDVFVILIQPLYEFIEVESRANDLFTVTEEAIHFDKNIIKLTASLGVSIFPRDGKDGKELLMNADAAMLKAKHQGGNAVHIYEEKINANVYQQLQLESNLHKAVKNGEFLLQYQPVVDLKTGKICSLEALVRWQHPTHGFISPADFIPLAEANGLILPLGEWVLRTACKHITDLHRKGFDNLKVAVNLSSKQLYQKNLIKTIADILRQTHLNPEFLELELTESEAFKEDAIPALQEFKEMGLSLAIDDFGTGYSGLSNIKQFAINKLKIDKSFVQDISTNHGSKAIVTNIIALAKSIHVHVLAEGVENKTQLDILQAEGCDMIQGYYFSPPASVDVMLELLSGKRPFEYLKNRS